MKVLAKSQEETAAVAELFLSRLKLGQMATVVGLYGDLGAGKTAFTQGLAWALGVEETVASPTFVIMKIYHLGAGTKFKHLIHLDCYRLADEAELAHLGFAELLADPGNLIVIEWPERIPNLMPVAAAKVNLRFIDNTTREIIYED